jgi:hypothetical protein
MQIFLMLQSLAFSDPVKSPFIVSQGENGFEYQAEEIAWNLLDRCNTQKLH